MARPNLTGKEKLEEPEAPTVARWLKEKLDESEDPTVARVLWALVVCTTLAILVVALVDIFTDDLKFSNGLGAVLKLAGAVVVLLGSYYAARTINNNREDQVANRYMRAVELLGHEEPVVRLGGVHQLEDIGKRAWKQMRGGKVYPKAALDVLSEFAQSGSAETSPYTRSRRGADLDAANRVLAGLRPTPESGQAPTDGEQHA